MTNQTSWYPVSTGEQMPPTPNHPWRSVPAPARLK